MTVKQSGRLIRKNQSERVLGRKARAQARQNHWNNLSTAEKLQQKIDQGHGDTSEAGALAIKLEEEMKGKETNAS